MTRIAVQGGLLGDGAQRISHVADAVRTARGELDAAGSSAGAAGAASAIAALEASCAAWTTALGALDEHVGRLSSNLASAGDAYAEADSRSMGG